MNEFKDKLIVIFYRILNKISTILFIKNKEISLLNFIGIIPFFENYYDHFN